MKDRKLGLGLGFKAVFHQAEFCARSDIFRATDQTAFDFVAPRAKLSARKCRSARKIPPSGKQALY